MSGTVYDGIISDIVTGKLTTKDVITEKALIQQYQVSKSPVRDALVKLCNEKILVSIPRFGYKIQVMDEKYLAGIKRFRLMVEPRYLELYFDTITSRDIERIRKDIPLLNKENIETPMDYWLLTSKFHLSLAYSYRDLFFYHMMEQLLAKQLITFSTLYWNNWSDQVDKRMEDNHSVVLDAIENNDKSLAVNLLRQDIESF